MQQNYKLTKFFSSVMMLLLLTSNFVWSETLKTNGITQSLDLFGKAWNEPNAAKREALINEAWAENGEFMDPANQIKGRKNLLPLITDFVSRYPGAQVIQTTTIDQHHYVYRASWKIVLANGTYFMEGTDFGEFNKDGKITRVTSFFGPATTYNATH